MSNILRLRIPMTGGAVVGPSVMTLYYADATTGMVAAVKTLLGAWAGQFPATLTFNVPNNGDTIDPATGALTGTWTDGDAGTVTGTSNAAYLKGCGIRVVWSTGGIVAGRRVHGSTFLVPLTSNNFDATGQLQAAVLTPMNSALQTYYGTMGVQQVIWSRPVTADATKNPPVVGRAGSRWGVTAATLLPGVSTLRSRRV